MQNKKVLILGDSISLGVHDCKNGGWANYLQDSYPEVEVVNESVSGFTAVELWGRLPLLIEKIKPTQLILAVGINDNCYYENSSSTSISFEKSKRTWEKIFDHLKKFSLEKAIMGLTPVFENEFQCVQFRNNDIKSYNNFLKMKSIQSKAEFIEVFDVLEGKRDFYDDPLHPNSSGHKLIYEVIQKSRFCSNL